MKRKLLFWSFIGMLISFVVLNRVDAKLQNGNSDYGIVAYELAKTSQNSNSIINEWARQNTLHLSAFGLGFDYLFMLFYTSFFIIWTLLIAENIKKTMWHQVYRLIVFAFAAAFFLDGVENYVLLQILESGATEALTKMAFYCASFKFALIAVGVLLNFVFSIKIWILARNS